MGALRKQLRRKLLIGWKAAAKQIRPCSVQGRSVHDAGADVREVMLAQGHDGTGR
jgi:hypothetical protein